MNWRNPCVVCHETLGEALETDTVGQPFGGTAFRTHGHYGSTVFDPGWGDGPALRIVICDRCLRAEAKAGRVLHEVESWPNKPALIQTLWEGPGDDE